MDHIQLLAGGGEGGGDDSVGIIVSKGRGYFGM